MTKSLKTTSKWNESTEVLYYVENKALIETWK